MSTFNDDNYLSIIFYLDGTHEVDEIFDYEKYKRDIVMDMEAYKKMLETNVTGEIREHALEQLDSLEKLNSVLKAIWEDDPADFFEYYNEEDEE